MNQLFFDSLRKRKKIFTRTISRVQKNDREIYGMKIALISVLSRFIILYTAQQTNSSHIRIKGLIFLLCLMSAVLKYTSSLSVLSQESKNKRDFFKWAVTKTVTPQTTQFVDLNEREYAEK